MTYFMDGIGATISTSALTKLTQQVVSKRLTSESQFRAMTDEQLVAAANNATAVNDTISLNLIMKVARARNAPLPPALSTLSVPGGGGDSSGGGGNNQLLYIGGAALVLALLAMRR